MYEEMQWKLSPMNAANNVNGVGAVARTDVYTLDKHGGLLAVQEALTRKIVTELNGFDNLFFEICNEPYFGGVTIPWQHRIADVIVETERGLPARHLIAQNIANNSAKVVNPHPCGVDLQLPLRDAARHRRPELRARQGHRRRRDRVSRHRPMRRTAPKRGTSSSPAAGCTTISTTRLSPVTKTARSSIRRRSPAAATARFAAR